LEKNIMKIRPLHDRVIVRREEEEQTTAGGILLPGSAQEKPNQGEVIAVGSGRILDNGDVRAVDVKVGDIVVFGQYAGNDKIDVDGEELIILSESDIKAVIDA
jgi:chaperonin GroES